MTISIRPHEPPFKFDVADRGRCQIVLIARDGRREIYLPELYPESNTHSLIRLDLQGLGNARHLALMTSGSVGKAAPGRAHYGYGGTG